MKPLSILAAAYGVLLLGISVLASILAQDDDDFFRESLATALAEQGTSIEQYSTHWNTTLMVLGLIGVIAVLLSVGIWRQSETAMKTWIGLVVTISAAQIFLLVSRPLPFEFEQVDIIDFTIHSAVLLVSLGLFVRLKRLEATSA